MDNESSIWRTLRSITHRSIDLQPWFDYFDVLHTYVQNGMLEILTATSEAYITHPALHTLAGTDEMLAAMKERIAIGSSTDYIAVNAGMEIRKAIKQTARFIWYYTQFLDRNYEEWMKYKVAKDRYLDLPTTQRSIDQGSENLRRQKEPTDWNSKPQDRFALHVVGDTYPHDLIYTIVLSRKRRWWWPWRETNKMDIIYYRA